MSLAAKLPWTHRFAGGFSGIGSQPLPTDADAIDYLARVKAADGAGVEVGVATAVDAFIRDAKELGVFSALKACCILAGSRTLAGALVPVVGDAPTNVANGFVNGDFSRTAGLTGDGATTYLDSGRAADADGQDDVHLSRYLTAAGTVAGFEVHIGARRTSGGGDLASTQIGYSQGSVFNFLCARNEAQRVDVSGPQYTGFAGVTRSVNTEIDARINGSNSSAASTSESPPSIPYYVFARNQGGSTTGPSNATIAFYSIGTSLSLEDLDTAVTNLINRLKFALLVGENPSGLDPASINYIVSGYENGSTLQ